MSRVFNDVLMEFFNPTNVFIVSDRYLDVETRVRSSDHIALFYADQFGDVCSNHLEINGVPVKHIKSLDNDTDSSWEPHTVSHILEVKGKLIQLDYLYSSWDEATFEDAFYVEPVERVVTYTDYRRLNPNFVV